MHAIGFMSGSGRCAGKFSAGRRFVRIACCLAGVCLLAFTSAAQALTADELLLITNKNIPEGHALAIYYAKMRDVPEGRILDIPLPVSEGMTRASYDEDVVPRVREYLKANHLEDKVHCLVTFYGVPLRIEVSMPTPPERGEVNLINDELKNSTNAIAAEVQALDKIAISLDPSYKANDKMDLFARVQTAMAAIEKKLSTLSAERQNQMQVRLLHTLELFGGKAAVLDKLNVPPNTPPDDPRFKELEQQKTDVREARDLILALSVQRHDPKSRQRIREMVKANFGLKAYMVVLQGQADILTGGPNSVSAVDSELSLLWWDTYPLAGGLINPLAVGRHPAADMPPTMMVMRLDAPQAGTVRDIINTSLKAEREGLSGRFIIDTRGIDKTANGYGVFDQLLRDTSELIRKNTKVPVLLDNAPPVLPAGSVDDMALYCGWYSVRNYVCPVKRILPGAVGYHVASYELISLRTPGEKGWGAGLLNDGIAATLGAVAEPYLAAFPPPQQFFPLLMTGKLTLSEVYWRTTPQISWMMCMIGDPLYRPYALHPAMKVEDLPADLRAAVDPPPATNPAANKGD